MFRNFEKLLGLFVFGAPLYILVRFLKWFARQGRETEA